MDERAVLFLKIKKGHRFGEQLVNRIRKAIEKELTVRHIPDVIIETKDIPSVMCRLIKKEALDRYGAVDDSFGNLNKFIIEDRLFWADLEKTGSTFELIYTAQNN
ncbi:hypothetical protein TNCV_962811 [Trichonephila clavipes]|nr:hypothetical protein TNCV_962811 [Trichonephila clavipes]